MNSPENSANHPPLKRIPGPSAFGGSKRRFFSLLWLTSTTEFKLGFHGTVLGYIWSLARPLMLFGILLLVFTKVFRFGDQVADYPSLLLLNIMLYSLFGDATAAAVGSLVDREALVRRAQLPRIVIPTSTVLTTFLTLTINLVAVFIFILANGVEPRLTWLYLPVILIWLLALTLGTSYLLSAFYPRFRDIALIWTVVGLALFYGTPILYPIEVAPEGLRALIELNPLSLIFIQAHHWIIDPNAPTVIEATAGHWWILPISLSIFVGVCAVGLAAFSKEAPKVAEEL
jgi:ABC-2 type transport system permease protein